ncbi:MAG: hypothetical protein CL424_18950 [Acidimicrobiaceae bacterium]|nr:hypothetical protein [Acidimicrobiaceae bacterium]
MSGADPVDPASELAAAQAEIARLRRLVGPHEHAYDDLKVELHAAEQAVRDAEAANGELRAEITELRVDLRRARQDQYHLWKLVARPQRLLRALRQSAE